MSEYMGALRREITSIAAAAPVRIRLHTLFFGGGTPSLIPPADIEHTLDTVTACFDLSPDAEITLEANPGTVTLGSLRDLRSIGVNRLSMGMQSADADDLRLLEREHDFFDVLSAVRVARKAGFENLNLDLIFGLPGQPLARWKRTLDIALGLQADHYSLYNLILEHGTPMKKWVARGLLAAPDDDLAAEMYECSRERMSLAGYRQYEISNWARSDGQGSPRRCKHNLQYWRNLPYLGLGAGAHGFAAGYRTANVRAPAAYIQRMTKGGAGRFPRTPAVVNATPIDLQTEMAETMMMGLRLVEEGIGAAEFESRFGQPVESVFGDAIAGLVSLGLLAWSTPGDKRRLRLTDRGLLLGNRVFAEFI